MIESAKVQKPINEVIPIKIQVETEQLMEDWKRLHQIPEIGFHEYQTSGYLRSRLESLGFEVRSIAGTGLLAALRGSEPGQAIGLRADMDALEFNNEDGSKTLCHACGHDAHCAMVLAAGAQVARKGIRRGTLYLLFQPAEETICGASAVVRDGGLPHLDGLLGMHLRPKSELPLGQATAKLMHQATIPLTVTFYGKAAHGARPFEGMNALSAAAEAIVQVDRLKIHTDQSWSAKATNAHCFDNMHNVIPERCSVTFDLRAQSNALGDQLTQAVLECADQSGKKVGCRVGYDKIHGYAAEYDQKLVAVCEEAIREVLGEAAPPVYTLGSEDFHAYHMEGGIPVAYMGLGADLVPGLHSRDMRFNPECLSYGVQIFCRCISRLLELN